MTNKLTVGSLSNVARQENKGLTQSLKSDAPGLLGDGVEKLLLEAG